MDIERITKNIMKSAHIEDDSTCWIWTGAINSGGYNMVGYTNADGRLTTTTPQLVLFKVNNDIELTEKVKIERTCDQPRCINPEHYKIKSTNTSALKDAYREKKERIQSTKRIEKLKIPTKFDCNHPTTRLNVITYLGEVQCRTCLEKKMLIKWYPRHRDHEMFADYTHEQLLEEVLSRYEQLEKNEAAIEFKRIQDQMVKEMLEEIS